MNAPDHLVADAADRLFAKHAAEAESALLSRAFWNEFTGAGLDQVLAFESETGYHDAVSVLRAAGYHAVAAPIAEAVLARWLAAKAGWELEKGVTSVAFSENDFEKYIYQRVPWGRDAGTVLAVTQSGVGRIETAGVQIEQGTNLAGEPRDEVLFDKNVNLTIAHCKINSSEAYALAALLRAAQMAGAMERALDLAIEHANTRVQFGRQIGKFQAVQQMLAQLASHAAAAAAAVDLGADGLAAGDGLLEAAIAKSRAGEAAGFAAEISHQVIGAMGFTMEHALQRCTRRLWSWRDEYGNEAFWNARIGEAALKADAGGAWPLIVDRPWLKYAEAP
jgi:hypothetical protein